MRVTFTKFKFLTIVMLMTFFSSSIFAQTQSPLDLALRHIEDKKAEWKLTDADISDLVITNNYVSSSSQAHMIYFNQRHEGVKIFNAIYNVAISKEGKVAHSGNRIISDVASKVNSSSPSLTADVAIEKALTHLGVTINSALEEKERIDEQNFVFEKGNYSKNDIKVNLQFFPINENEIKLVWGVNLTMVDKNDGWYVQVDAANGEILEKISTIIKCTFENDPYHNHNAECRSLDNVKIVKSKKEISVKQALQLPTVQGGSYNVYAEKDMDGNIHPHESPTHGDRNLMSNLEHPNASPYGWHDTDGVLGAELTITRGNNVHAYLDISGDDVSQNDEPDGGAELIFDFPLDINTEPDAYAEAAVTNAFFMVNWLHDFSYEYGFDEAAGNYQVNNYGNGGLQNDWVNVQVHDGDGSNNADFNVVPDGSNGSMQMYLWNAGAVGLLTVNEPINVAGVYDTQYAFAVDMWGAEITDVPVTGEVAIVDDGSGPSSGSQGCDPLINGADVSGKIAIVDRGGCEFGEKAFNAQNAGAIGVIICNFQDDLPPLGGGAFGGQVNIPVVGISSGDCNLFRQFAGNGLSISLVQPSDTGPEFFSGALDNGVIAHEFGHGISLRLVGGANQPFCLSNGEQMGEGISDFFTLVTTVKPGDTGDMVRGIGTFVQRQDVDGRGIRRFPYSTDMNINPLTYKDILGQPSPHGVGEIWTLALWEMYWLLVDEYGFDPDLVNGTGGNNIAVQIVMEGMKLKPCGPGYIDGRDAILNADLLLNDGINACLIWQAFAKRGMGEFADQVSPADANDGIEDFTFPGFCSKDIQINKSVTELVEAGDVIDVSINVTNWKDDPTPNTIITDEIPAGTSVIAGSASNGGTVNGNTIVFDLGTMEGEGNSIDLTYQLETNADQFSLQQFYDDVENDGDDWDIEIVEGGNAWDIREDSLANSGEKAWFVRAIGEESQQNLFTFEDMTVEGTQPVLRFYHWYNTEAGEDGGLIEISKDGGSTWEQQGDNIFRSRYPSDLSYFTLVIPFLEAFSGSSSDDNPEFIASYVDLSDYIGENIRFRFRFGTSAANSGIGWFVDDIEMMDMINYNGEVCVTTDDGDNECATASGRGTVIESQSDINSTNDLFDPNMNVNLFPNPASDQLNIQIQHNRVLDANIQILSIDGKEFINRSYQTVNGLETISMSTTNLPAGFYLVKVMTTEGIVVEKLTIK